MRVFSCHLSWRPQDTSLTWEVGSEPPLTSANPSNPIKVPFDHREGRPRRTPIPLARSLLPGVGVHGTEHGPSHTKSACVSFAQPRESATPPGRPLCSRKASFLVPQPERLLSEACHCSPSNPFDWVGAHHTVTNSVFIKRLLLC